MRLVSATPPTAAPRVGDKIVVRNRSDRTGQYGEVADAEVCEIHAGFFTAWVWGAEKQDFAFTEEGDAWARGEAANAFRTVEAIRGIGDSP